MIKIFLFHSHELMTSEMLIERQCLHHNKQCIQAAEKSSWLMYGWLVVHGPHDSPKYIFNKSCHSVRVTDNYPKDTERLSDVFLFYSLQLWLYPFSFQQISKQCKQCGPGEKKKT